MVGFSLDLVPIWYIVVLLQCPCEISAVAVTVNSNSLDYTLTVEHEDVLSLICTVQNHTAEETLLWYRGDQLLNLDEGNQKNVSSVCVSPVTPSDNGVTFSCQLQRNASLRVTVALDVQFRPSLNGEGFLTVEEGNHVKISCKIKSNPQAAVVWYKDNNTLILEEGRHHLSLTSEFFELAISKAQKSDNGTYTCVARYANETLSKDFFLTVEDRKEPFPLEAIIAASVVVLLTAIFGIVARRKKIFKCGHNSSNITVM
ncbi:transmembrane and immunoglobulin domain-containing protein 1 [Microcaecilia unicolor]|uniref:transmembrane and immunoglobulin domain-containing protein 1 n=1 Tax=Microcaecilia unicolor TaxID=1415580 RepID=UPI0011860465|nr:transmembrane and immunoglobulin domain-containing protein 1 [Microcaecilia unicolor]XP_030078233.1 transmembrane and immunoglobulin domain-containing protein 1 [Microcaecilia unicolor]